MKTTDFYTRPASEAGIVVPLLKVVPDPTTGQPVETDSGEWLRVHGPDSQAFAHAESQMLSAFAGLAEVKEADREALATDILLDYHGALLIAWSFDEDFTPAAVRTFLHNAPRIAQQVAAVAADVNRFFGPGSPSSTPGPASSTSSKAATSRSRRNGSKSRLPRARKSSPTSSTTGTSSAAAVSAGTKSPPGAP